MKCEIDVIIDRKHRWNFKELLSQNGLTFKEWLVEFHNDRSIISFQIDDKEEELLKNLYDYLKENVGSRVVLPDGNRLNPKNKDFGEFYRVVCKYIEE